MNYATSQSTSCFQIEQPLSRSVISYRSATWKIPRERDCSAAAIAGINESVSASCFEWRKEIDQVQRRWRNTILVLIGTRRASDSKQRLLRAFFDRSLNLREYFDRHVGMDSCSEQLSETESGVEKGTKPASRGKRILVITWCAYRQDHELVFPANQSQSTTKTDKSEPRAIASGSPHREYRTFAMDPVALLPILTRSSARLPALTSFLS